MVDRELESFTKQWNKVLSERATPKKEIKPVSFFTDRKKAQGGPDKTLVEGWQRIVGGAEDYETDYRSDVRSEVLASDQDDDYETYGQPPVGSAAGRQEELLFQENFKDVSPEILHWAKLAKNLKLKEAKSVKGSGFVNTSDAAALLEMSMEHFLRCVWNVPGFPKPQAYKEGMAYSVEKLVGVKEILNEEAVPKEGFGKLVRGKKAIRPDTTYETEPITFNSPGNDSSPAPTEPVRVSKFSTSPELNDIAEMKRKLEVTERRVHKADVQGDKVKRDKLAKEVKSLRDKIDELSDAAQSKVDQDIT